MIDNPYVRAVLVSAATLVFASLGAWADEVLGHDTQGMLIIVVTGICCGAGTFWLVANSSPAGLLALALPFATLAFGVGVALEINTGRLREHGITARCEVLYELTPPSENSRRWRLRCPD
ncbi:hypothetical protein ACFQ07_08575, partial [Actinomadura adrarensis]